MNNSIFKSRFVAAILTGIVVLGTPLYIVAEDEDLTNQLDSIQQQVNQQNAKKADAETVIVSVSEQLRQIVRLSNNWILFNNNVYLLKMILQ